MPKASGPMSCSYAFTTGKEIAGAEAVACSPPRGGRWGCWVLVYVWCTGRWNLFRAALTPRRSHDETGDRHARTRARDVVRNEGVSNLQALQRVLYRSAKQDPTRRFHALYDKLTRSAVMWQAWVNVARNRGTPGVDGVSIDSIGAGGMEGVTSFLDTLATEAR